MKVFFFLSLFSLICQASEGIGLKEQEALINELEELKKAYSIRITKEQTLQEEEEIYTDKVDSSQAAPIRSSRKPVNLEQVFERVKKNKVKRPNSPRRMRPRKKLQSENDFPI